MDEIERNKPIIIDFVKLLLSGENTANKDLESKESTTRHERLKANREIFLRHSDQVLNLVKYIFIDEKKYPFEEDDLVRDLKFLFKKTRQEDQSKINGLVRELGLETRLGDFDQMMTRLAMTSNCFNILEPGLSANYQDKEKILKGFEISYKLTRICHSVLLKTEVAIIEFEKRLEAGDKKSDVTDKAVLAEDKKGSSEKKSKASKNRRNTLKKKESSNEETISLKFDSARDGKYVYIALPGDSECNRIFHQHFLADGMKKYDGFVLDGAGNPINVKLQMKKEGTIPFGASCTKKDWGISKKTPPRQDKNDDWVDLDLSQHQNGDFVVRFPGEEKERQVFYFKNNDESGLEVKIRLPHVYVLDKNNCPAHIYVEAKELDIVFAQEDPDAKIQRYSGFATCNRRVIEQCALPKSPIAHSSDAQDYHLQPSVVESPNSVKLRTPPVIYLSAKEKPKTVTNLTKNENAGTRLLREEKFSAMDV